VVQQCNALGEKNGTRSEQPDRSTGCARAAGRCSFEQFGRDFDQPGKDPADEWAQRKAEQHGRLGEGAGEPVTHDRTFGDFEGEEGGRDRRGDPRCAKAAGKHQAPDPQDGQAAERKGCEGSKHRPDQAEIGVSDAGVCGGVHCGNKRVREFVGCENAPGRKQAERQSPLELHTSSLENVARLAPSRPSTRHTSHSGRLQRCW